MAALLRYSLARFLLVEDRVGPFALSVLSKAAVGQKGAFGEAKFSTVLLI